MIAQATPRKILTDCMRTECQLNTRHILNKSVPKCPTSHIILYPNVFFLYCIIFIIYMEMIANHALNTRCNHICKITH